ncbi:MAG: DNA repair protein [Bacilli bacterium]|nr:DNA repair protein [Bacilli bacterium]
MKWYLCIDLKTFYASVECVERGLDPFKTDLIVADPSRGKGSICLAITPKMKKRGIKNRCRVFEIPKNIHPIVAKPRMIKYMQYSTKIYSIYLKYIDKQDIHVYSIDEAFLDVTSYLKMYNKNPKELAIMIMDDIYKTTHITATCGIGTNMYLAKIALDIISKHTKSNIGILNEKLYKEKLSHHTPLTDFWGIGRGIENRLHKLHLKDMYDISNANENILYKEFGINAKLLIDHSKGIEPCTIKMIKDYKPKNNSMSNTQILFSDYTKQSAKVVLTEMIHTIVLRLVRNNLYTDVLGFYVGYSKDVIPGVLLHKKIDHQTNSFNLISNILLEEYDYRISEEYKIRKLGVFLNNIKEKEVVQLDIFNTNEKEDIEFNLEKTLVNIQDKYGKNSILNAISYTKDATQLERNKLIGGHNAM